MPPRLNLDEQRIIELYTEEKKSAREIAKIFGTDHRAITKRLKERNIPIEMHRNCVWYYKYPKDHPVFKNFVKSRYKVWEHPNSKKTRLKKGSIPWHKGKTGVYSDEVRYEMGSSKRGKPLSLKRKEHLRKISLKYWEDPAYRKKMCLALHRRPNYPEKRLLEILNKHFTGWKYTGDLSFFVGRKNPDFVNEKEKKAIDLFGEDWHTKDEEKERINYFKERGWELLIVWCKELKQGIYFKEEYIKEIIKSFISKKFIYNPIFNPL